MAEKKRIAAYTRVSTNKEEQLNSLENQKNFFENYAKRNNYELVRIYSDEGLSGLKLKNRTEFLNMMEDARKGLFDIVITKGLDRFSRNTVHFLQAIRELKELGIDTVFLTNNLNVIGQGELTLGIFSLLAQEESSNISKRTKWGKKQQSLREGCVPTCVFGYDIVQVKDKDNRKKSVLQINEEEAETVRLIFSLYTSGEMGSMKIAHLLNERGIRTKRGSNWTQAAVCRILTNELYTGKIINGKQEIADYLTSKRKDMPRENWIYHDYPELRIIDQETFENTQAILRSRQKEFKLNKTRHSCKHIFSTLIKCTYCGYSFRRLTTRYVNTFNRWVCSGRNVYGKNSCTNDSVIDEEDLLDSIKKYFVSLTADKKQFLENAMKEFNRLLQGKNKKGIAPDPEELNKRISRIKNKRNRVLELFTDGIISKDEMKQKIELLDREMEVHIKKLESLKCGNQKPDIPPDIPKERIMSLFTSAEMLIGACKFNNSELKQVIDRIDVSPEGDIFVRLQNFKS